MLGLFPADQDRRKRRSIGILGGSEEKAMAMLDDIMTGRQSVMTHPTLNGEAT